MHALTKRLITELFPDLESKEELDKHYFSLVSAATLGGDTAAICTKCKTVYKEGYEPDQRAGFCEECESNSVKSILILENMI